MDKAQKAQFIAESLSNICESSMKQYRKVNKELIRFCGEKMDVNGISNVVMDSLAKTLEVVKDWEGKSLDEIEGLTPEQYFDSLNSIDDIVEVISLIGAKSKGLIPESLRNRIKRLDGASENELLAAFKNIRLGEDKCLDSRQKAIVHMAEIMASPVFVDLIANLLIQLDDEKSDEESFMVLNDAIREIGEPAHDKLAELLEGTGGKGKQYGYLLLSFAKVASYNKTEKDYILLKSCFRNSPQKLVEAAALGVFGDGRAIPAIRGYIEKNIEDITYWEYVEFRNNVLLLGGDMSDLDRHFAQIEKLGYYDKFDDKEEYDD